MLRLSGDKRRFRDMFIVDQSPPKASESLAQQRKVAVPALVAVALLLLARYPALSLPERAEIKVARTSFVTFPMQLGEWRGRPEPIEKLYLDYLQLDGYVNANFMQRSSPR